jgi:hypothetical protein
MQRNAHHIEVAAAETKRLSASISWLGGFGGWPGDVNIGVVAGALDGQIVDQPGRLHAGKMAHAASSGP